ncbi:glutamyl-tRNA reductase [Holophaga foetida]|uniref:glutamyl-tRNA reductase n=1 Tax=Holophaga foetida TaxID=35839 RepID=UPI0002473B06|nr:glutamyl-tRNA reductase [Holophaga foetida]
MEPTLYMFCAPHHPLEQVGEHVVSEGLPEKLKEWQRKTGARELVYLCTCQRVLWMLWEGDVQGLSLAPEVMKLTGDAAWLHLLSLASGLESANVGDREIPGQIRTALDTALDAGTAGEEALSALEDILREAHRLRSRIGLDHGQASVATVALKHVERFLDTSGHVLLVGVGPMTQYLAARLPERGYRVTVTNRSLSRAHEMADPLGLPVVPLDLIQRDPGTYDCLVTATASPEPIFTRAAWQHCERENRLLILDLALPPDSEPSLEQLPWVQRLNLGNCLEETEQAKRHRKEAARQADPFLNDGVERLRGRARKRAAKRRRAMAHERLSIAWEALNAEAAEGPLAELLPDQALALQAILRRGRTLAFRALAQSEPRATGEESPEDEDDQ